nr:hypothetical protein [Lacisediminimonas profundi]
MLFKKKGDPMKAMQKFAFSAIAAGAGAVGGSILTGGSTGGTLGGAAVGGIVGHEISKPK